MNRQSPVLVLALLAFAPLARGQDIAPDVPAAVGPAPAPDAQPPLAEGQFRVKAIETAATTSVLVIEAVVEAPSGSVVAIGTEAPDGTRSGSQSTLGHPLEGGTSEIRFVAKLDRFGLKDAGGRLASRDSRTSCGYLISTRSEHGGTSGGGSVVIPLDQPLKEALVPVLEPGDHPLGSTINAFRFQGRIYTIRVTGPGAPAPLPPGIARPLGAGPAGIVPEPQIENP